MSVLHRWYDEVWNQGRASAIDEMMWPDAKIHGLTGADGQPAETVADFKAMYTAFRSALSDIHAVVEDTVYEGDLAAARVTVTAKHTGDGLGRMATGNPIRFTGMSICRLKDDRIAEGWNNFDFATMFQQMK